MPELNFQRIVLMGLIFFAPLLVIPSVLDDGFETPKAALILAGVLLCIAATCIKWFRNQEVSKSTSVTPGIILLLFAINALTFFYTENPYYTKAAVILNVGSLLVFIFVYQNADECLSVWFFIALAVSGVIVAVLTIFQAADHFILFESNTPGSVITSTIGNSNTLGVFLIFPSIVLMGIWFIVEGKVRWIVCAFLVVVLAAVMIARARASWIGLGGATILFVLLMSKIHNVSLLRFAPFPRRKVIYGTIAIIIVLGASLCLIPKRGRPGLTLENITDQTSFNLRKKYWQASWHLWAGKSPVLGTGLWSYRNLVYDSQAELELKKPGFFADYDNPKPRRVHNEYLEILNDGGVIAACALLLFICVVMGHGYQVIQDDSLNKNARVVSATAFATVSGIMVTAIFFFTFRISITLFMTSMMLGIMEGIYIRSYRLLGRCRGSVFLSGHVMLPIVLAVLAATFWYGGYRPVKGEWEHRKFKISLAKKARNEAEKHLLNALSLDPQNTVYCFDAACFYMVTKVDLPLSKKYLSRSLVFFNGDVERWTIHYLNGVLSGRLGNTVAASKEFEKAVYYNPVYEPAIKELQQVKDYLKKVSIAG